MVKLFQSRQRFYEASFLALLSVICFALILGRMHLSESRMFLFLVWNLFLAAIPWVLTTILVLKPKWQNKKLIIFSVLGAWLLFFPNAPYILTDLFHLQHNLSMPVWFDLTLVLAFAWTGLVFGFLSLWDIEQILNKTIKPLYTNIISSSLLYLTGFGIYLGRYLRWNSWDILDKPLGLINDIGDRVVNPFEHPRTWGMTILMGTLLNMFYWSFKLMRKRI